jgi:hypothetical protein
MKTLKRHKLVKLVSLMMSQALYDGTGAYAPVPS